MTGDGFRSCLVLGFCLAVAFSLSAGVTMAVGAQSASGPAEGQDTLLASPQAVSPIAVGEQSELTSGSALAGSTGVSLHPTEATIGVDSEATFDVVVDDPHNGVSAFEIDISLSDGSVASITDFEHTKEPDFKGTEIASDGNSMTWEAGQGENVYEPGSNVVIGTMTLEGEAIGETNIQFDDEEVMDTDNDFYSITSTSESTLSVAEEASFAVSITDAPDVVEAGQDLDVSATVENTGGLEASQTVEATLGTQADDSTVMSLSSGAEDSHEFVIDTSGVSAGEYDLDVSSDDDTDTVSVTVEPPPQPEPEYSGLSVEPTDGVAPESITASATVQNVGDPGTIDVPLVVGGSTVDTRSVTLDDGESTAVEFDYEIEQGGQHSVSVGDLSATTVDLDSPQFLAVSLEETNAPILAGDPLNVTATVQNTGDLPADQDVTLSITGVGSDSVPVSLDAGGETTVVLQLETEPGDDGTREAVVSSVDDSDARTVTIGEVVEPSVYEFEVEELPNLAPDAEHVDVTVRIQSLEEGEQIFEIVVNNRTVEQGSMDLLGDELVEISPSLSLDEFQAGVSVGIQSVEMPGIGQPDTDLSATVDLGLEGTAAQTETVTYTVDGTVVDEQTVEVTADGSPTVTLSGAIPDEASGEVSQVISIGDTTVSGTLVVEAADDNDAAEGTTNTPDQGGDDTTDDQADDDGAGFGVLAAVAGLLVALLLVRPRR